ncbi:hypothetical protein HY947_00340 [Candidatus Gottesmanbacteria bacterium]|nr:hypothetical protein [Candidatus Gottesmanbacteria bacterium]
MHEETSKKLVLFPLLICIIGTVFAFFIGIYASFGGKIQEKEVYTDKLSRVNSKEFRSLMIESMAKFGAKDTYAIVKKAYKDKESEKHNFVHIFGEELYNFQGLAGIGVCDSTFLFACFHGFMSRALGTGGVSILPELSRACVSARGERTQACMHGAGHGLVEYMGTRKIKDAIAFCAQFGVKQKTMNGCVGGAIMEYNFGSPGENSALIPRPTSGSFTYPCNILDKDLSASCYFEQMQWVLKATGNDMGKAEDVCASLEGIDRIFCFRGIGNFSVVIDFDVAAARKRCDNIEEKTGIDDCKIGAAGSYMAVKNDWKTARKLCEDIDNSLMSLCPLEKL